MCEKPSICAAVSCLLTVVAAVMYFLVVKHKHST